MSKTDLRRPGRSTTAKRDSIEAHHRDGRPRRQPLAQRQTGWSIKKLLKTLRATCSIAVQTGGHILHAGTPLDDDTRAAVSAVTNAAAGH